MLWLTGGALAVCTVMVVGLVLFVFARGAATFWPQPVVRIDTHDGRVFVGEVTRDDDYEVSETALGSVPEGVREAARAFVAERGGLAHRRLLRTGNYRETQAHFAWVSDFEVATESRPEWALVLERLEWGRFYGEPEAFLLLPAAGTSGEPEVAEGPAAAWAAFERHHAEARARWRIRRRLERVDTGEVNARQERARLAVREAELELADADDADEKARAEAELATAQGRFEEVRAWADGEFARIRVEIDAIDAESARYILRMRTAGFDTQPALTVDLQLSDVVRAYPPNRVGFVDRTGIYLSRWREFLADEPREANSEGGVFPAIFGTVAMTLIMAIAVVPFGVLAALYLREYAKAGALVAVVRIAVNNLAGVPSIVFGVFGLGFFCYVVGASLDELLFAAHLPNPTYGKGGLMWASFTLALLTLPVVIVATEEAVAAVPNSMREGSYACGASKWQTIQRIVLPRALPGIITGMVLAIARGAGEVAPLMLVGAVKLAPELPIDGDFPFLHPERSFMHLGFHVYDVGFQSQNSEAAKPMVFTTTLLLIALIALLNLATVWLRSRLRRRFAAGQF